ncbi:hypothetical protein cypCar_00038298 [Cyprinus carpio]|nr:hypothetical protein cypCar_00038298 [Cyprinus carpio]
MAIFLQELFIHPTDQTMFLKKNDRSRFQFDSDAALLVSHLTKTRNIRVFTEQLKKMFHMFVLFCLCWWRLIASHFPGVFGESVSMMEGESIALNSDVTKIRDDEDLLWKFGAEKTLIAEISKAAGISSTYNGTDGRFRDRLKLDDQTGSLTITDITTEHAGVYELLISGAKRLLKTFNVSVYDQGLPLFYIVLISAAGSLLIVASVVICSTCKKCRKTVQAEEEDRTDSALCKSTRKTKSKTDAVYENVPKKR